MVASRNANMSIAVTLSGITILFILVSLKVYPEIYETASGITKLLKLQFANA